MLFRCLANGAIFLFILVKYFDIFMFVFIFTMLLWAYSFIQILFL